jgi:hypothetical protein
MTHRILSLVCLSVIFLSTQFSHAQNNDEFNLDDSFSSTPAADTPPATTSTSDVPSALPAENSELNLDAPPTDAAVDPTLDAQPAPQPAPEGNPNPLDALTDTPSNSLDLNDTSMMANQNADTSDQGHNVNLASPVELRQRENALYGFSVGLMLSSSPFHEKYNVGPLPGGIDYKIGSVDRETDAIQSLGVMLRYAETPYYALGTDINVSFSKSQNHHSITVNNIETMSEVTTLKGEMNLTYAIDAGGHLPVYFLAGLGAERITGGTVENFINPMGYGGQVGGGFAIASAVNLEALYFYYTHRISNRVREAYAIPTNKQPGDVDTEEAQVINQGLLIRGSYSFNF